MEDHSVTISDSSYESIQNLVRQTSSGRIDEGRLTYLCLTLLGFFAWLLVLSSSWRPPSIHGLPIANKGNALVPGWLARLRFIRGSRTILQRGYERYRSLFVIHRWSGDVVVIGEHKYLEEIRSQTKDSVRSVEPFLIDLAGDFCLQGQAFLESNLQNRVLGQKLTPKLEHLLPVMRDELQFALMKELPDAQEWVQIDPLKVFPRIIARIVARVFIGPVGGRDEDWLEATTTYTENIFATGFILRFVPRLVRHLVAPGLPTYRKLTRSVIAARRLVSELVSKRAPDTHASKGTAQPDDVLQWTMNMASEKELGLDNLTERMQTLSLSAIHTTAVTQTQLLYDLCTDQKYIDTLRDEIVTGLRTEQGWSKSVLARLDKLDSALKESQRMNPVFLLTYNRYLPHSVTLSNGIYLPARTRIAVPQYTIGNDPTKIPGDQPGTFNPWRYTDARAALGNDQKYGFSTVDPAHMAFGYGKYACPGRFFVNQEIKLILAHLLLRYEWKFPDGQSRPKNFTIDGDMYPDRSARLMLRRRALPTDMEDLV